MSQYQVGYVPPGDFGRMCDVCGRRRPGSTFRQVEGIWICDLNGYHNNYIPRKVLDKVPYISTKGPEPIQDAKPFNPTDSHEVVESEVLNFICARAPTAAYSVTASADAGAATYSPEAAAWAILYLYGIIAEAKRPVRWLTEARTIMRTLADWLLTQQCGSGYVDSAITTLIGTTATTDTEYGGFITKVTQSTDQGTGDSPLAAYPSDSVPSAGVVGSILSRVVGVGGLALLRAYQALGDAKYRTGYLAAATCIRRMQNGDKLSTAYAVTSSGGTGPYHSGMWTHRMDISTIFGSGSVGGSSTLCSVASVTSSYGAFSPSAWAYGPSLPAASEYIGSATMFSDGTGYKVLLFDTNGTATYLYDVNTGTISTSTAFTHNPALVKALDNCDIFAMSLSGRMYKRDGVTGAWTLKATNTNIGSYMNAGSLEKTSDGNLLYFAEFNSTLQWGAAKFNTTTNTFTVSAATTTAFADGDNVPVSLTMADGKVLFAGSGNGTGPRVGNKVFVYDPVLDSFSTKTSLSNIYAYTALGLFQLQNGKILFIGTAQDLLRFPTQWIYAEVYDPNANTWTPAANDPGNGALGTYVGTPDGKVWIIGGSAASLGAATKLTSIYDPATNSFSAGPSLNTERWYYAFSGSGYSPPPVIVTPGAHWSVIAFGGSDVSNFALATTEKLV